MNAHDQPGSWIGRSLLRKEDNRHLLGASTFVGDIRMPGMQDIAFVRSAVAHGRLRGIDKPAGLESRVYALADLGEIHSLESGPEMASFRSVPYPPLASDRVRFVGQTVAACLAPTRAEAEDMAERVVVHVDELPAVIDTVAALGPDSVILHDGWPDNAFVHDHRSRHRQSRDPAFP
eukprot:gene3542-4834_t